MIYYPIWNIFFNTSIFYMKYKKLVCKLDLIHNISGSSISETEHLDYIFLLHNVIKSNNLENKFIVINWRYTTFLIESNSTIFEHIWRGTENTSLSISMRTLQSIYKIHTRRVLYTSTAFI